MEIGIKVIAEDIRSQVVRHVNSCFFTMVAVDDDRKPVTIPPLVPSTPEEQRRFEEAKGRRDSRLALERQHAERAAVRS
jgi:acyl-CoA hydrolase